MFPLHVLSFNLISVLLPSAVFLPLPLPVHLIHLKVNNTPAPPGDYEVSIKFNNEHIPDSPFIVPIATLSDEARRLTVTSLQVGRASSPQSHGLFAGPRRAIVHTKRTHM